MKKIKHFLAAVVSLSLVLASMLTVSAAELPDVVSTDTQLLESKAQTELFYVKGNGIHLRRQPSLSSEAVGMLYEGQDDWIITNHNTVSADGEVWYEVVSSSIGRSGWIAGKYLDIP